MGLFKFNGTEWVTHKDSSGYVSGICAKPEPFRYFIRWAGESDWEEVTKENYIAFAICADDGCAFAVVTGRE